MISLASATEGFDRGVFSVGPLEGGCDNMLRASHNTHQHTPWNYVIESKHMQIQHNHRTSYRDYFSLMLIG